MRALSPSILALYAGSNFAPRARVRFFHFPASRLANCIATTLLAFGVSLGATSAVSEDSKRLNAKSKETAEVVPFNFTGRAHAARPTNVFSSLYANPTTQPTLTNGTRPFYLPPYATLLPNTPVRSLKSKIVEPTTHDVEPLSTTVPQHKKRASLSSQRKLEHAHPSGTQSKSSQASAKASNADKNKDPLVAGAINQFDGDATSIASAKLSADIVNSERRKTTDRREVNAEKPSGATQNSSASLSPKATALEPQNPSATVKSRSETIKRTTATTPLRTATAASASSKKIQEKVFTPNGVKPAAKRGATGNDKDQQQSNETVAVRVTDTKTQSNVSFTSAKIDDNTSIERRKSVELKASALEASIRPATTAKAIKSARLSSEKKVAADKSSSLSLVPLPEAKPHRQELAKKAAARRRSRRLAAAKRRAIKPSKKSATKSGQPPQALIPGWANSAFRTTN